jgi:methyl-accepting chemotaxis protein
VVSKLETVNREVKRATDEEVQSIVYLEEGLRAIRDSMEVTRSATQEQGASLEVITGNIQSANAKTAEIAGASLQQKNVNGLISESMRTIMTHGGNTLSAVQDAAGRISAIYRDVELLRHEMGMFRVSGQQPDQLADEPGDQLSEQLAVDTGNEKGYTTTGLDTNVSSSDV